MVHIHQHTRKAHAPSPLARSQPALTAQWVCCCVPFLITHRFHLLFTLHPSLCVLLLSSELKGICRPLQCARRTAEPSVQANAYTITLKKGQVSAPRLSKATSRACASSFFCGAVSGLPLRSTPQAIETNKTVLNSSASLYGCK